MTEEQQDKVVPTAHGTPRWVGLAVVVLAVVSVVGLGLGWSASNQVRISQQSISSDLQNLRHSVELLSKRIEQAEETNAALRGELSVVTDRLKLTRGELARARKQAKEIREEYANQLAEMDNSLKTELAAKADAEDVEALSGDLTGVRGDIEATRQSLHMARGELGTLIARNHEEIEELRRIGLRDYFEFSLERKGSRQKFGTIMIELRGTNTRKNQFTVALHADDLRLEKKNRAVNEPIYFYTRGFRSPLELVINKVGKDKIIGYLSVPKGGFPATAGN